MNIQNKVLARLFKFRVFILVIVILFLVSFELALGTQSMQTTPSRRSGQDLKSLQENLKSVTGNFNTSLEMKENVDFLLTPALLVQEAISEDVVITYPSE